VDVSRHVFGRFGGDRLDGLHLSLPVRDDSDVGIVVFSSFISTFIIFAPTADTATAAPVPKG